MKHDHLFKELLRIFFVEFVELFLPEVAKYLDVQSIEFLDKELFTDIAGEAAHEVDLVVKAKFKGKDAFFLIHVEHQGRSQRVFPERMFLYFARLYEKYRIPIYPVAILSYKAPKTAAPDSFEIEFPGMTVLKFNYTVIQLNRLRWRDFLDNHNPVATALMAQMQVAAEDRRTVRRECLRLLATQRLDPAKSRVIGVFIESYLKLSFEETKLLEQELSLLSPAERDATMEMMTSWHKAGWREGLREGRSEGIREGLREGQLIEGRRILLAVGRMRLGEPGESELDAIHKIESPEEIEAMIARVLSVETWSQLI